MEEEWAVFLSDRIGGLARRFGHRQVKTLLQPDTDTIQYDRDRRSRCREQRLPR